MFKKDYLLRMVEEMTDILAKVFDLKQQRKMTEALSEIDELLIRQFGLNSKLLRSLPSPDIIKMFRRSGVLEADKLQSAARLMEEEAKIYLEREQEDEGLALLAKVHYLYLTAFLNEANLELWDLPRRIDETAEQLRSVWLSDETERLLLDYCDQMGRYAEAENSIFRLLERKAVSYEEGKLFYEKWLQLSPDELERGGLPLSEVQEGIDEFERRLAESAMPEENRG